jgi:protein SDA1
MAKKDEKFVVRVIIIALLSRMINRHKLMIMPFYGMLQKYMHPGQKDVGKILACFAESVHSQVPETELQPIIKHIV